MTLSEAERTALENAKRSILVSAIPGQNQKGVFSEIEPGLTVYKRLETRGLVYLTDEDPIELENGEIFQFTPTFEITDEGLKALES